MAGDEILWRGRPSMMQDPVRIAIYLLLVPFCGLGLLLLLQEALACASSAIVISRERIASRRGILSKATSEIRICDVRNVQLRQTFFQRLLGLGDLGISSAAHCSQEVTIYGIRDPEAVAELVRQLQRGVLQPAIPRAVTDNTGALAVGATATVGAALGIIFLAYLGYRTVASATGSRGRTTPAVAKVPAERHDAPPIVPEPAGETTKEPKEMESLVAAAKPSEKTAGKATLTPKAEEKKKTDDRPKKVNRLTIENFSRVQDGMTYAQVKRIIGPASEETLSSSAGVGTEFATKLVMLTWKGSWGANCNVTFQDGRAIAKAQFGLPHGEPTEDLPDEEAEAEKAKRQAQMQAAKEREEALKKQRDAEKKRLEADAAARWRTWTSADSGRTIKAQYRGTVDGKVRLRKEDGTDVFVPPEKLSEDDQQWLEARQKRSKK